MADRLSETDLLERQVWRGFSICRAGLGFAIAVAGSFLAPYIQGLPDFARVSNSGKLTDPVPYCYVMLYPYASRDTRIYLGTYGKHQKVAGINHSMPSYQFTAQRWRNITNGHFTNDVSLESAQMMPAEECKLIMPKSDSKVLLINAKDGLQVPLSGRCGGKEPGPLLQEAPPLSLATIIPCVWSWYIMRLLGIFIEYCVMEEGFNSSATTFQKFAMDVAKFAFFTLATQIMLAPIQNLQFSELCPQVLTTFYNEMCQVVMAIGAPCFVLDFFYIAYQMKSRNYVDEATWFVWHLFMIYFNNGLHFLTTEPEDNCCKDIVKVYYRLLGVLHLLVPAVPIAMLLGTLCYHVGAIANSEFWVVISLYFDLTMYFPLFHLAWRVNLFHVLTALLSLLDLMSMLKMLWVKLYKRWVKDHAATSSAGGPPPIAAAAAPAARPPRRWRPGFGRGPGSAGGSGAGRGGRGGGRGSHDGPSASHGGHGGGRGSGSAPVASDSRHGGSHHGSHGGRGGGRGAGGRSAGGGHGGSGGHGSSGGHSRGGHGRGGHDRDSSSDGHRGRSGWRRGFGFGRGKGRGRDGGKSTHGAVSGHRVGPEEIEFGRKHPV